MNLNRYICYNSGSDAGVYLPLNVMVMSLNLCWQGTQTKAVYTGGGSGMRMYGGAYTMDTIIINLLEKLTNQKRPKVTSVTRH